MATTSYPLYISSAGCVATHFKQVFDFVALRMSRGSSREKGSESGKGKGEEGRSHLNGGGRGLLVLISLRRHCMRGSHLRGRVISPKRHR
jgi:hypothetical protein